MTEMIDRVARAMFAADFAILAWEDASPRTRTTYVGKAGFVIRAMREPTDGMIEAGRVWPTTVRCWRAMIDAALSTASRSAGVAAGRAATARPD